MSLSLSASDMPWNLDIMLLLRMARRRWDSAPGHYRDWCGWLFTGGDPVQGSRPRHATVVVGTYSTTRQRLRAGDASCLLRSIIDASDGPRVPQAGLWTATTSSVNGSLKSTESGVRLSKRR